MISKSKLFDVYFGKVCLTISVINDGLQQIMSNIIMHKSTNINRKNMQAK